jgi:short-subunit dehydrogenase
MEINSKIAIVTGASKGAGAAFSKALTNKGATVYGLARNEKALKNLQTELGDGFLPIALDISDENAVRNWAETTFSKNHCPDILINNAGASQFAEVDKLGSGDWHKMVNTNLNATHYLVSALVPLMKKNKSPAHIINIGSILGKTSGSKKSAYSATKFAIQGYSEALFKELRGFNIKVTCLNPGSIATGFFKSSGIEPNESMLQPEELAQVLINVLETPDNVLIDELTVRPLRPR